jgi:hypothetical protein
MTPPVVPPQTVTESGLSEALQSATGKLEVVPVSALDLLNSYAPVFVIAFVVALLATPLIRPGRVPGADRGDHVQLPVR